MDLVYLKPEPVHLIYENCPAIRVRRLLDTSPANPEGQQRSLGLSIPLPPPGCWGPEPSATERVTGQEREKQRSGIILTTPSRESLPASFPRN